MTEDYTKLMRPPANALKPIKGGDINGKTDVNPQWRYEMMNEVYGACGDGWDYEIIKLWDYPLPDGTIMCFAQVNVFVRRDNEWCRPVPGVGGNTLVDVVNVYDNNKKPTGEKRLKPNDEGYKMAITDALSTALKMLGVAADIYRGNWDGAKYRDTTQQNNPIPVQTKDTAEYVTLKGALIDYINSGAFEHPDNVNKVIAARDIAKMKQALAVAKEKENA